MIFAGDVALPFKGTKIDIPDSLCKKDWLVNLEGSIVDDEAAKMLVCKKSVFNNISAIKELKDQLNIKISSIANNHIEDCTPVNHTIEKLIKINLAHVGAGRCLDDAARILNVQERERTFTILAFGWDVIKCPVATSNKSGVNPYRKKHVIKTVKRGLESSKNLICLFHWGYELEELPLPYDRELAHTLIEMGVNAVIGCHAHRVQQIEFFKGKPIVYGLGNFLFPHSVFWNGRLKFPKFTKKELAFEITENGEFITHWFEYDIYQNRLKFLGSERIQPDNDFEGKAGYTTLSSKEYDIYFRNNRYHKKLLPVFKSHESSFSYSVKRSFVIMRRILIDMLVKLNVKAKK